MILFHDIVEIFDLADGDGGAVLLVVALDGRFIGRTPVDGDLLRHAVAADRLRQKALGGLLVALLLSAGNRWSGPSYPRRDRDSTMAFDLDVRLVDVIVTTHKILALVFHTQVYKLKREMSKKNLPASVSPFTFMQNEGMEVYDENPAHSLPTHGSRPTPGGAAPQSTQDYSGTSGGPRCK